MRVGEGHPRWPAWDGEIFSGYLRRLAENLEPMKRNAPEPGRRIKPIDKRSAIERIDAIFDGGRQPGEDDEGG